MAGQEPSSEFKGRGSVQSSEPAALLEPAEERYEARGLDVVESRAVDERREFGRGEALQLLEAEKTARLEHG